MARDTTAVYTLGKKLREVMLNGGTLEDDGSETWSQTHFQWLSNALTKNIQPQEGDFVSKLADQIENSDQFSENMTDPDAAKAAILRLCIELLGLYYAYPTSISTRSKKKTLNQLLKAEQPSITRAKLSLDGFPNIITAIDTKGIGSGGMGYNTNRQKEFFFLVELFHHWFELTQEKRHSLLSTGARLNFQNWIDQVRGNDRFPQTRHLLLFYLDPDYYEPIVSTGHKSDIVSTFRPLLSDEAVLDARQGVDLHWHIDQTVHAISKHIESLREKPTKFYDDDLWMLWGSSSDGLMEGLDTELLDYKKQIVLYGPPGTGKTYTATELARDIIRHRITQDLGASVLESAGQTMLSNALNYNIHRLQLHPAYSYEDFVRGLQIQDGDTRYRDGYLLKLLDDMSAGPESPHVLILDEMNRVDLSRLFGECFSAIEHRNQKIDLVGSEDGQATTLSIPENLYIIGTMNLIDHSVEQLDFALRRRFLWVEANYSAEALLSIYKKRWEEIDWSSSRRFFWDDVEPDFERLIEAATQLNKAIESEGELGRDFMVGHAFFADAVEFLRQDLSNRSNRPSRYLFTADGRWKTPVSKLWRLSLAPLLNEYLAGVDAQQRKSLLERLATAFRPRA